MALSCDGGILVAPVSAVAFITPEVLCVGVGPSLRLFLVRTGQLLLTDNCLHDSSRIHNISVDSTLQQLTVHGRKQVAILSLSPDYRSVTRTFNSTLRDWVLFSTQLTDCGSLLVGLAHNELEIYERTATGAVSPIPTVLPSPQKVLLYSLSVHGSSVGALRVAAGTAIGGVLVWDVVSAPEVPSVKWQISGHDGVIFRAVWASRTQLATASDDRTARLWQLSDDQAGEYTETNVSIGHRGRVWDVLPLDNCTRCITASEDASVRVWDGSECSAVLEGHSGRGVWRIAHCVTEDGTQLLATGGNDGTTRLWKKGLSAPATTASWQLPPPSWWGDDATRKGEMAKSMAWDSAVADRLVVGTNKGMLWQLNVVSGEWTAVHCDKRFSFCCIEINLELPCGGQALLAGTGTGELLLVDNAASWAPVELKAHSIPILVCFVSQLRGLTAVFTSSADGALHWHGLQQLSSDQPPQFVAAAVFKGATPSRITSVCVWEQRQLLVCGTAAGGLEGFPLPGQDDDTMQQQAVEVQSTFSLRKVHKSERVTAVWISEDTIFSAGRDGSICRLQLSELQAPAVAGVQRVGDVVSLIESVEATPGGGLLVSGTKGSQFLVYDTGSRAVLMQTACGGSKRPMNLLVERAGGTEELQRLSLAFSKDGVVNIHRKGVGGDWAMARSLGPEFHGREVVDALILEATSDSCKLVTASEDTTVRLLCRDSDGHLATAWSLEGHTSSVRSLCLCDRLLLSAGGAAELVVWQLQIPAELPATQMLSLCLGDTEEEVTSRCLAVRAVKLQGSTKYLVAVAVSDSTIRLMTYDSQTVQMEQLTHLTEQHGPIISLELTALSEASTAVMVSGATDGTVAVWRLTGHNMSEVALQTVLPACHQSGVNCLHMSCSPHTGLVRILSGGDDQAVTYTEFCPHTKQHHSVTQTLHGAALRGVFLEGEYAVSTGADQRVVLWRVAAGELCPLSIVVVEVADVSTLSVSSVLEDGSRLCVVGGLGLATVRWSQDQLRIEEFVPPTKKAKAS